MFQPDATPIFAHPDRTYRYLESCSGTEADGGGAVFHGVLDNGSKLDFSVTMAAPNVIRVRYHALGGGIENETPYLVKQTPAPAPGKLIEEADAFIFQAGQFSVRVEKSPWRMSVRDATGAVRFQQEISDKGFGIQVTYPTGYSETSDGQVAVHENFSLAPEEHLFGLGPKYMSLDKRGRRCVMWVYDTHGTTTTELSYLSVPFFMSSRGYGLFLNHGARSIFEMGSYSTVAGSIWLDAPLMDYFLILGNTPAEILDGYTMLTGRPEVPPKWAFGVWMSRAVYEDRETVETVVERARSLQFPLDAVNIDPAWLKGWRQRRQPGCTFEWDTEGFPEPDEFLQKMREKHVHVCLWENPYVPDETDFYEEGKREGYLLKTPEGGVAEPEHPLGVFMGIIDYSNPRAVEWVKQAHRPLLRQGISAFKTDYGESVPENCIFHDGKTGREMHNLYPLLYNQAVYEVIKEMNGEAIVYGRSGGPGSQRYPIQWAGDSQCNYSGMAGALIGGLSYALSGGALWGHDIGGFINPIEFGRPPAPTLFVRWAQFGLLSPIARFHGQGVREPWEFGEEALRIVRKFALLRSRLVPYLYSYAYEANRTGLPVMRPLYLEFPDDPHAPFEELEYLLGRELLVAPVFNDSGEKTVYLPAGAWTDFWDGAEYNGPQFLKLRVPLDKIPLFVREESILPLCREMQHVEEYPWDELELHVRVKKSAYFNFHDGKDTVRFEASRFAEGIEFKISPSHKSYKIILHGVANLKNVKAEGKASDVEIQQATGETTVFVKSAGEIALRIFLR